MKITLAGDATEVRTTLRHLLLDVPNVTPEELKVHEDGTATVTADVSDEHAELVARIAVNVLRT
ncbi:hypothetical protein ACIBQX_32845 [Nonomuraea sp. NPDC049714]|uniref:hypothetical protein n=1 Tax=Nonomuraea sp. NPDC049714 TaxID=3364357 RepID=UPI0037907FAC